MSPPLPDISLPQNGKLHQAPKPGRKTRKSNEEESNAAPQAAQPKKSTWKTRQSRDVDKEVNPDTEVPVLTPAASCPVPRKKSGPANGVAPGADAKDESFIPARALKKPSPIPPPHHPPPEDAGLPPRSLAPDSDETPPPPPSQPRQPPALQLPCSLSPIVLDPGCTPSPSNFEATRTAEQLAVSWMCPEKRLVSQEEVDEEDDQEFKEEIQAQLNPKGKKGKGKTSKVNGPFKLGPVPDQAKERAFAIHMEFEKQIQDLATEIGKAPQLLFSLPVSSQDWAKLLAEERTKYCKDELGDKWKDPDAVAELFAPIVAWHKEKHGAYVDEMKVEGTFNKVVGKVQHEFMCLGDMAYKYNGVHCFGFIINLQPDHTGRTGTAMWGATPAFEQMKIDEKDVISRQIANWEALI
ncbi:hypothetical protein DXG01_007034, partial [Tephrocybe rancida]